MRCAPGWRAPTRSSTGPRCTRSVWTRRSASGCTKRTCAAPPTCSRRRRPRASHASSTSPRSRCSGIRAGVSSTRLSGGRIDRSRPITKRRRCSRTRSPRASSRMACPRSSCSRDRSTAPAITAGSVGCCPRSPPAGCRCCLSPTSVSTSHTSTTSQTASCSRSTAVPRAAAM